MRKRVTVRGGEGATAVVAAPEDSRFDRRMAELLEHATDVFFERGMERPVSTVLTLTRVHPDDPAFQNPTKPVGPYYEEHEAKRLEEERGWTMAPDPKGGWRRVVPQVAMGSRWQVQLPRPLPPADDPLSRRTDRCRVRGCWPGPGG